MSKRTRPQSSSPTTSPSMTARRPRTSASSSAAPVSIKSLFPEHSFDLQDILSSSLGASQIGPVVDFYTQRNWLNVLQRKCKAYRESTILFYAYLKPVMGSPQFSITMFGKKYIITPQLIAEALGIDTLCLDEDAHEPWPLTEDSSFVHRFFVNEVFIDGKTQRHHLRSYALILMHVFLLANLIPGKGNKTNITGEAVELLWCMTQRHVHLSKVIFHAMKSVGNSQSLSFPCFISSILKFLNVPLTGEVADLVPYKAKDWNKLVRSGISQRRTFLSVRVGP
ncbi:hypothetical protein AQUCO_06800094v1 [Aquilegia coerulea]|uniref:Putative plant transposon protein domain-containing protein n=1 Tax=Aquilegia coerulea TaxID=218851 RepID=A0A2G5CBN1_AQUCA|nr:hypothetical protein AQUCO_06800094v1 [Aquilegia coerulea]